MSPTCVREQPLPASVWHWIICHLSAAAAWLSSSTGLTTGSVPSCNPWTCSSLYHPSMGSGYHQTLFSWFIWWKNNTSEKNGFSIGQTAELIHLVTPQLQDQGRQKPGSEVKQNWSFQKQLNQLNCILCAWFDEQCESGQAGYSWKGQGFLQPHSGITSFLLLLPFTLARSERLSVKK